MNLLRFLAVRRAAVMLFWMWPALIQAQSSGAIGGAGMGLRPTPEGYIVVDRIATGGPADQAGIQPGDQLVAVGHRPVTELGGTQLVDAIRGPIGTKVALTYSRGGKAPVTVDVIRADLSSPPQPPAGEVRGRLPAPAKEFPSPPQKTDPQPPQIKGAQRFTAQVIRDPAANQVPAVTFLLPQAWQYQGQVVWLHEYSVLANLRLRLWETNSDLQLEWLPTQHFSYTDQLPGLIRPGGNWMGAILAPPIGDPATFVESFWTPQTLTHLRGLPPISREDYPGIAQQAIAQNPGWRSQAVRLRYTFDRRGQAWEQDVYFTLAYAPANAGISMWNVQRAFTASGPKGRLDASAAVLKAVIANVNFTPEWLATYSVVQQLRRQGLQQQMADTQAFGRQLQQYNAQVQQLSQQMHAERMKSFDRIAESQREYLGGVETYSDPYQNLGVYLPSGYREHWVNQKGEILLSDQTGFNPNTGDVNDWRRMERRDPMQK